MPLAQTESGLLYPAEGMDAARLRAALKDHDRNLDLTQQIDPNFGTWVYKVVYAVAPERQEVLFAWRGTGGEPLPLSSGILDKVKLLDKNSPVEAPDPDKKNAALREADASNEARELDSLKGDHLPRVGRAAILHRGQSLRQSRDKQRARGKKV